MSTVAQTSMTSQCTFLELMNTAIVTFQPSYIEHLKNFKAVVRTTIMKKRLVSKYICMLYKMFLIISHAIYRPINMYYSINSTLATHSFTTNPTNE